MRLLRKLLVKSSAEAMPPGRGPLSTTMKATLSFIQLLPCAVAPKDTFTTSMECMVAMSQGCEEVTSESLTQGMLSPTRLVVAVALTIPEGVVADLVITETAVVATTAQV